MKLYSRSPNEVRELMYPNLENENSGTKCSFKLWDPLIRQTKMM